MCETAALSPDHPPATVAALPQRPAAFRSFSSTIHNCPDIAITPDGNHILSGQKEIHIWSREEPADRVSC
jgi:hypothetical protein